VVWRVVFAEREFVDTALRFPLSEAEPKIPLSTGGSLVAFLRSLGE
jgi:hypothetical protein